MCFISLGHFSTAERRIKCDSSMGISVQDSSVRVGKEDKKADTLFLGLGHWTRSNAEICLLATKGSVHRKSAYVRQIILSHIERHSKKPDVARDRIVELIGDVPRIELFARQTTPGWDVWGNEIQSDIEMKSEEEIE